MFECSKFSQTPFLHRLLEIRRAAVPPTPSIAMWPPEALELDEPHPGLYFYRPGELLVPGEQADLFRRPAVAIGVEFGDASDNCARPRGESHESVEGLEGTLLTGAARFTGVTFRGEFDPEVVITALEEEAQRAGNTLTVTPNHVVFGSQHWLVEPCGDPNTPSPGEHLERRRGGEDIVVAVIDSGLPGGYIANPLMAPVNIANNEEL